MKIMDALVEALNEGIPEGEGKWKRMHSAQGEYDEVGRLHGKDGRYIGSEGESECELAECKYPGSSCISTNGECHYWQGSTEDALARFE
jgi:hypothetical protein